MLTTHEPEPAPAPAASPEERLRQLRHLLDEGLLDQQEYEDRRRAVIGSP